MIQAVQEFLNGIVKFGDGEELPMPERGQYPAFHDANGVFHFRFVTRLARTGGHDCNAVMLSHLVIGAVQIRLVPAGSRHAGARVVRNQQSGSAAEELEGMHMTIDPLRQVLSHCGAGKRISAGAEDSDEDRCRRAVTGLPVVNRNRVAGPIDECFLSRFVIVPEHHIASAAPPWIQFAEAAITIAAWLRIPIFSHSSCNVRCLCV